MTAAATLSCRACRADVTRVFLDLGQTPLANAYLDPSADPAEERRYPLRALVCETCLLVQLDHDVPPEVLFADYAYFSSYSDTWMAHAKSFAEDAVERWGLDGDSLVMELASNDGYLLKNFVERGVPVLGIEPAANVAEVAQAAGVPTEVLFFDAQTAQDLADRGSSADLVVANNVFAHVPDTRSFAQGLATVVRPGGVVSLEFPHLLRLIEGVQFDTIYHEHFCYFSLLAVENVLRAAGLHVFDVVQLPTHGGSLRVLAERADSPARRGEGEGLLAVRALEDRAGLADVDTYSGFATAVDRCRDALRGLLAEARREGQQVVGYGAAAKGNTLLNYCDVGTDDIAYVVDRSPHKQGRLLPGTRIPIVDPAEVMRTRPDYVVVLPWNLVDEITQQMAGIRDWGGRFVVPLPEVRVLA